MASAGTGGGTHLAGELFKTMAGVNLVHVPYRGNGPALVALLGGQAEVLFPSFPSSIEYIRTGKLRGLAVTSAMPLGYHWPMSRATMSFPPPGANPTIQRTGRVG
jgi:tripartite-type tricarboxylate transporter receptor subunit TctC